MIKRIDFCTVHAIDKSPNGSSHTYTPKNWPGWTVTLKGQSVILEEQTTGKMIEVPRSVCVIYSEPDTAERSKAA